MLSKGLKSPTGIVPRKDKVPLGKSPQKKTKLTMKIGLCDDTLF